MLVPFSVRDTQQRFFGLSTVEDRAWEVTLKVMRDGRPVTVEVTADGAGLVSRAGSALLARVADKLGLTGALSRGLGSAETGLWASSPGRAVTTAPPAGGGAETSG